MVHMKGGRSRRDKETCWTSVGVDISDGFLNIVLKSKIYIGSAASYSKKEAVAKSKGNPFSNFNDIKYKDLKHIFFFLLKSM